MAWVSLENLTRFYTKLKEKMYLKTEVDTKLSGKANTSHTHNYADSSHTHDDRYYTESEINSKISNATKIGIDKSRVLASGVTSYTATENCFVVLQRYNAYAEINVNGVGWGIDSNAGWRRDSVWSYVGKGQTVSTCAAVNVYGLC